MIAGKATTEQRLKELLKLPWAMLGLDPDTGEFWCTAHKRGTVETIEGRGKTLKQVIDDFEKNAKAKS